MNERKQSSAIAYGCVFCGARARPLQKQGIQVCVELDFTHRLPLCNTLRTFFLRRFYFMQETKEKEQRSLWQRLFFSGAVRKKNKSHKIAYIAVVAALCVVVNMFEIKFVDVQFSLTLAVSALAGIILGGAFGFVACFLGDLVGFLYNSSGYMYMPWIGIAMGCVALISGMLIGGVRLPVKGGVYIKLGIVSVSTFLLCTVGINTTAFWLLYSKVSYGEYLISRLFIQGQIWNSLVNYVLLFIAVPVLGAIKPLRLYIR